MSKIADEIFLWTCYNNIIESRRKNHQGFPAPVLFSLPVQSASAFWKKSSIGNEKMEKEKFYKSRSWERVRTAVLKRDKYQCQICKRYGRNRQASTAHHIKHFDEYPELALSPNNLISLCKGCHNKMHPEKGTKSQKARYI